MRETTSQTQYVARQNQKCWLQNKPERHQKNRPSHGGNGSPAKGMNKTKWGEDPSFLLCLTPKRPSEAADASGACRCATWAGQAGILPLVSCLPHPVLADLRESGV